MKSEKELVTAVLARAKETEGRKSLTCAEALTIAAELDVEAVQIGRICDQQEIRIRSCQLGCFS
jgi:hypothetical protein